MIENINLPSIKDIKRNNKSIEKNRIDYTKKQYNEQKIDVVHDSINEKEKVKQIDSLWSDYEEKNKDPQLTRDERSGETIVARDNRKLIEGSDEINPDNILRKKKSARLEVYGDEALSYFETGEIKEAMYSDEFLLSIINEKDADKILESMIKDVAEDGTSADVEKLKFLLGREDILKNLEIIVTKTFRNMLSLEKGTGARVAAYKEWMDARNGLIDFEKTSLDHVLNNSNKSEKIVDMKKQDDENIELEYIPGEVA